MRDHGTQALDCQLLYLFYCAVRTCTIGAVRVRGPQHSIIALFCTSPFMLWLKDVWSAVCNQSNVFAVFLLNFLGHPLCGRHCCHCPFKPCQPEWWMGSSPLGHFKLFICSISTVIAPLSRPIQDSAAASTCGRGPGLCGTVEFHFLSHMTRSCWLHAL